MPRLTWDRSSCSCCPIRSCAADEAASTLAKFQDFTKTVSVVFTAVAVAVRKGKRPSSANSPSATPLPHCPTTCPSLVLMSTCPSTTMIMESAASPALHRSWPSANVVFRRGSAIFEMSFMEKPLKRWQALRMGTTELEIHSRRLPSAWAFCFDRFWNCCSSASQSSGWASIAFRIEIPCSRMHRTSLSLCAEISVDRLSVMPRAPPSPIIMPG
mmetsp:Transcript_5618/g.12954  ORF Transcript_5618/g.12954 Transcript_5618/m.12954 type:complete len:214 (+) Transcript_5618:537-1178(+)